MVRTAAFHASARGSVSDRGGLTETKNVSSPSTRKNLYCGLCDHEVACSVEFRILCPEGSDISPSSVLLAQLSLNVHKSGLKSDSFHFTATYSFKRMKITQNVSNLGPNILKAFVFNNSDLIGYRSERLMKRIKTTVVVVSRGLSLYGV